MTESRSSRLDLGMMAAGAMLRHLEEAAETSALPFAGEVSVDQVASVQINAGPWRDEPVAIHVSSVPGVGVVARWAAVLNVAAVRIARYRHDPAHVAVSIVVDSVAGVSVQVWTGATFAEVAPLLDLLGVVLGTEADLVCDLDTRAVLSALAGEVA